MTKYKSAVIGLGNIGLMYDFDPNRERPSSHVLAYQLHPNIELVAAMDIREQQKENLKKVAPDAEFYTDLKNMLTSHELEIVSICTPPIDRVKIIKHVLEFSKVRIIFCEKPISNSIQEAKEIISILKKYNCILIPNLSRRWNGGIRQIYETIKQQKLSRLEKIHIRYTRGIYNTGSHIFDLIRFFAGEITTVRALHQVYTSSELEDEPSYTFAFECNDGEVTGFAEAFNDNNYYMFEMDMYFEQGKIEILWSGDEIRYYTTATHPLFSSYQSLHLEKTLLNCLKDSNLENAMEHIVQVLEAKSDAICTIEDGIFPLYVADALIRSFHNNSSLEKVGFKDE